ncbi:MAG TPA: hypothetical protein VHB79_32540 [Polyangiaceae bacterium]|nr:hypothetical protein [Polyangiaceae bacterium]
MGPSISQWGASGVRVTTIGLAALLSANACAVTAEPEVGSQMEALANYHVTPDRTAVAVGTVQAITHADNRVFFGGSRLSSIAQRSGSAVPLSLSEGSRLDDFVELQGGATRAIVDDGSGGWFVGGNFRRAGSTAVRGLVHILPDGQNDSKFRFSVTGSTATVYGLARIGNRLYVAGGFTRVGGQARQNLAAIDLNANGVGGTLASWAPTSDSVVSKIAVTSSTVIVGGAFFTINGSSRRALASLDPQSGTLSALAPVVDSSIFDLSVVGNTAYVVGAFTHAGGLVRNHIFAFDTATGGVLSFAPADLPAWAGFTALSATPSTVYVAAGETLRAYAATGTSSALWSVPGTGVSAIAVGGDTVYVGGHFTTLAGAARRFAGAVRAADGALLPWAPQPNASVSAVAPAADRIYLGGEFTTVGAKSRSMLAAIDVTTRRAVDWKPEVFSTKVAGDPTVTALASADGSVYVAGDFGKIEGPGGGPVTRDKLARVDTSSGAVASWDPHAGAAFDRIAALAVAEQRVFVGGYDNLNSTVLRAYAKDGAAEDARFAYVSAPTPKGPLVRALLLEGERLYVGGRFDDLDGAARHDLAAVDVESGELTPFAPFAPTVKGVREVIALAQNSSTLFVAWREAGDRDGESWFDNLTVDAIDKASGGFVPGFKAQIDALFLSRAAGDPVAIAADEDALYLGYEYKDGSSTVNVLSAATGRKLNGFAPNLGGGGSTVNALELAGGALYVGGSIQSTEDYDTGPLVRFSRVAP